MSAPDPGGHVRLARFLPLRHRRMGHRLWRLLPGGGRQGERASTNHIQSIDQVRISAGFARKLTDPPDLLYHRWRRFCPRSGWRRSTSRWPGTSTSTGRGPSYWSVLLGSEQMVCVWCVLSKHARTQALTFCLTTLFDPRWMEKALGQQLLMVRHQEPGLHCAAAVPDRRILRAGAHAAVRLCCPLIAPAPLAFVSRFCSPLIPLLLSLAVVVGLLHCSSRFCLSLWCSVYRAAYDDPLGPAPPKIDTCVSWTNIHAQGAACGGRGLRRHRAGGDEADDRQARA